MIQYLKARLSEKSTWAGIGAALAGAIASASSIQLPSNVTTWLTAGVALCGVIAVLVPR